MNIKGGFLVLLISVIYIITQIAFFNYYQIYGIPFGMSDVDNYMFAINSGLEPISNLKTYIYGGVDYMLLTPKNHPMLYYLGIITPYPDLLYTFLIPIFVCCILPMSMFIFGYYMSKDINIGIVSTIFMILGTYLFQSYAIWALWGQLFHTIFLLFGIVFFIEYGKTNKLALLILSILMAILMLFVHPKLTLIVLIIGTCRAFFNNKMWLVAICVIMGLGGVMFFGTEMDYPNKVGIDFVFMVLANPILWIIALCGMIKILQKGVYNDNQVALIATILITIAVSPLFALWRPVISILPFVAYFGAVYIIRFFPYNTYRNTLLFFVVLVLLYGFIVETKDKLAQMLWEMMPNGKLTKDEYRHMDYNPFSRMIFGGSIQFKGGGYVDQLGAGYILNETIMVVN